jgi:hypothetical protein
MERWSPDVEQALDVPREADKYYAWHCMRLFVIYRKLSELGAKPSVRGLDNYLLSDGNTKS